MKRLIPLAAVALTLGACGTPPPSGGPAQQAPNIVTNVHPYKPGSGVVQAVLPVPATAAAGSSSDMQRLEIKMQDGSIQYVDVASRDFPKGTRVSLTSDRFIKKS